LGEREGLRRLGQPCGKGKGTTGQKKPGTEAEGTQKEQWTPRKKTKTRAATVKVSPYRAPFAGSPEENPRRETGRGTPSSRAKPKQGISRRASKQGGGPRERTSSQN